MLLPTSGVRMLIFFRQVSAISASRSRVDEQPAEHGRSEPTVMFFSIDHSGKMPSVWRSPATSATGSLDDSRRLSRRRDGGEERAEHLGLALAAEAGKADDLAAMGGELGAVALCRRPGAGDAARLRAASRPARRRSRRRRPWRRCPSPPPGCRGVNSSAGAAGDDPPVAHDDDAARGAEDLAEEVRDQDHRAAARDEALDEGRGAARRPPRRARRSARRG